jgi:sugar phosphate isomerase/epimerase
MGAPGRRARDGGEEGEPDVPRARVALQMYTLREDAARDFSGTLRSVAAMGYPAVELAGYGGLGPEALYDLVRGLGLEVAGTHTGIDVLERDFAAVVRLHHVLGARYVTIPSLPGQRYPRNAEGFRRAAQDLEALGRRLAAEGLVLGYHNHDFEFFPVDAAGERRGLDILWDETDPQHVRAELDVYWARKAGVDPAAYIRKLGARCSLLHLKDMAPDGSFAEVGTGVLDFAGILAAGDAVGTDWLIVEQDVCRERPPLEAVRLSLENLRRWGRV